MRTLTAAMVLLLASCSTPLPGSVDDITLPDDWRTPLPVDDIDAPGVSAHAWWLALDDDGLNELVQIALGQNLDIAQAHKNLAAARIVGERAHRRFLPTFGLRMSGARDASARDSYLQFGAESILDLSWPIERQAASRQAQGSLMSAQAQWRMIQNDVVAAVVRTYAQLRQVQVELNVLETVKKTDARLLQYAKVRRALRLDSDVSLDESLAQARQHDMRIVDLELSADDLAQALAILLGQTRPDAKWFVRQAQPDLKPLAFERLPVSLLTTRPDIEVARAEVLLAAARVGMAQARLYPRLTLVSSWIYAKNLTNRGANNADSVPMVAPFIDVPLWDWGMRAAQRDARQAALDAAVVHYRKAVIEGYAQAESALAALQAAAAWARHADERVRVTGKTLHARQSLVRTGLLDAVAVVDDEREHAQARIAQSQARARRVLAFAALYTSLGAGPQAAPHTGGEL